MIEMSEEKPQPLKDKIKYICSLAKGYFYIEDVASAAKWVKEEIKTLIEEPLFGRIHKMNVPNPTKEEIEAYTKGFRKAKKLVDNIINIGFEDVCKDE